jgi:hypothetical protein
MVTTSTALEITVTVSPGMVLAPPEPLSIRLGLRQIVGTGCLAGSLMAISIFLAGQPWLAGCNGVTTIPYLVAGLLLATAADLLILDRRRSKRLRQSAIMNGLMIGIGMTLAACAVLNTAMDWPALFPLLFVVFAVPVAAPLNLGIISRLPLDPATWRVLTIACIVVAVVLMAGAFVPFQDHVACQWHGE